MQKQPDVCLTVTDVPELNLLGRIATKQMGISVDIFLYSTQACHTMFDQLNPDVKLRNDCLTLCKEFQDLWKPALGCLKDFELEVEFKNEAHQYSARCDQYLGPYKKTCRSSIKKVLLNF